MAFNVRLTEAAQRDIGEAMDYIAANSPEHARKWFDEFFEVLETLTEMPARHPLITESGHLKRALHSLHYHSHRVVYEINVAQQTVSIVRVYHSSRRPLRLEDLQ